MEQVRKRRWTIIGNHSCGNSVPSSEENAVNSLAVKLWPPKHKDSPPPGFCKQVPDFLERTKAEVLAVTVGNVHGKYANADPKLDLPRLQQIRDASSACFAYSPFLPSSQRAHHINSEAGGGIVGNHGVLLALHGASGLPSSQVRGSINLGVCKFNVNTEVRAAVVEFLMGGAGQAEERNKISGTDILGLLDGSVAAMRSVIEQKMREFDP